MSSASQLKTELFDCTAANRTLAGFLTRAVAALHVVTEGSNETQPYCPRGSRAWDQAWTPTGSTCESRSHLRGRHGLLARQWRLGRACHGCGRLPPRALRRHDLRRGPRRVRGWQTPAAIGPPTGYAGTTTSSPGCSSVVARSARGGIEPGKEPAAGNDNKTRGEGSQPLPPGARQKGVSAPPHRGQIMPPQTGSHLAPRKKSSDDLPEPMLRRTAAGSNPAGRNRGWAPLELEVLGGGSQIGPGGRGLNRYPH